ncbi:MAG: PqqD family protein [Actinomycetota bacterium]
MSDVKVIKQNPRVVFRELGADAGAVLLHLGTSAYFKLNETGVMIYKLTEEGVSLQQLCESVRHRLEDAPSDIESDIEGFVEALAERDLVIVEHHG